MFKKRKIKEVNSKSKKDLIIKILVIIFTVLLCFSMIKICLWMIDNYKIKNMSKDFDVVKEIKDNENTELVNPDEDPESDYWYYIKFNLYDVDFDKLLKKNKDTVGWINVNNTNINYPFVQTTNNTYYLNHAYDKTVNEAGWVFLDYRNNSNLTDSNNILYAHSRLDKSMFGSLSKTLKKSWYTDKSNHIIRISTPTENSLWQIFSVYKIAEESYYITSNFSSDDEFLTFLTTIKERSLYDFNASLASNDRILTLSTCFSETERTVVHAKLIKINNK